MVLRTMEKPLPPTLRSAVSLASGLVFLLVSGLPSRAAGPPAPLDVSRPDAAAGPTEVLIFLGLVDVVEVKEVSQSFSADLYLMAQWRDRRLAHPGPGTETRQLASIWNPRLQIANQRGVSRALPEIVEIAPDGLVTYRQRFWGEFSEPLELRDFPFDSQRFEIQLLAVSFPPEEVAFVSHPEVESGLSMPISLANWTVVSSDVEVLLHRVFEGAGGSAGFTLGFEARRGRAHFALKILMPLLLIVMMSWAVFWIDPTEFGPQISAATTAMLTLIAYRFMIGGVLPKISYLTRLDLFILGATVMVFLTLAEAIVTGRLARSGRASLARRIDHTARWLVPTCTLVLFVIAFWG